MFERSDCRTNPNAFVFYPPFALTDEHSEGFFPNAAGPVLIIPTAPEKKSKGKPVNILNYTEEPSAISISGVPVATGGFQLEKWTDLEKKRPYHIHLSLKPHIDAEVKEFLEKMLETEKDADLEYINMINILHQSLDLSFSSSDGIYLLYDGDPLFGMGHNSRFPKEELGDYEEEGSVDDNPKHPNEFILVNPGLYEDTNLVDTGNQWVGGMPFKKWRSNIAHAKKDSDFPYGFDFMCGIIARHGHEEAQLIAHLDLAHNSFIALKNKIAPLTLNPISDQREKGLFETQVRNIVNPEIRIAY